MSKKKVPWLVVGPEPYMATCERCGGTVDKPSMPLPIDAFLKYADYASELHRGCRVPVEEPAR